MTNLFAYRASEPKDMIGFEGDKIGPENNDYILKGKLEAKVSIAAWGNNGTHQGRWVQVVRLFKNLYCIETTKTEQPKHPLYLSGDLGYKLYVPILP